MIQELKFKNRYHETLFLGVLIMACFGLSVFRVFYSETKVFLFLNWNLFLAVLPWIFTSIAILKPSLQENKWTRRFLLCSWLLFFPNAPYIFTDLFHLRLRTSMPIWFDLILILSFAWTGLMFGFLSLMDLEKIYKGRISDFGIRTISATLLFIGSFGIYLGRYLRWNSWDIVSEPSRLMYDVGDRFFSPFDHPRTWGMTLFMGLFLNMIYWSFRFLMGRDKKTNVLSH